MRLFYNTQIHTLQSEGHTAQAAVVDEGRFLYVGKYDAAKERYPEAEAVDCKGKTMLPGFNDSHMHLLGYGMTMHQLDLTDARSIQDIQDRVREFAVSKDFVLGRGWNQGSLQEDRMPEKADLDLDGIDVPIILIRTCGHVLSCNSIAMDQAGAYKEDGIFREHEMDRIKGIIPPHSKEFLARAIQDAEAALLRLGITSVQTDDLSAVNEPDHDLVLEALKTTPHVMRVYEQTNFNSFENFARRIPGYVQDRTSEKLFRLGPIKILGDGSLGARTARLRASYSDQPDQQGLLNFTKEELMEIAALCEKYHLDMAIHAIGDQMLEYALDMTQASPLRHSIVHCQITAEDLLKRIADQKVMLHIQPNFLNSDHRIVEDRLGFERARYAYNYRTLTNLKIPIGFGTDCPVDPANPFFGLYNAVTRKDRSGNPENGYIPEESLTLYQALVHYTSGSAYGSYDEKRLGRIEKDCLADFILLESDPFELKPEDWLSLKVCKTYVGGELSYEYKDRDCSR